MNYKEQLDKIKSDIEIFGFESAIDCVVPEEIDNITFNRLGDSYIKARERLEHYILKHSKN